ncbi:MAG TPA: lipase family protein, partial [Longimicrobium sp.]|nr:lipase family protein [Longimicrobium sp.]
MSNINFGLTFALMNLASEAYNAVLTDQEFTLGYRNLDGSWSEYYSRQRWLDANGFTIIEYPAGSSNHARYWGIVTVQGSRLVVAMRGTDFGSWNDIAVDTWSCWVGEGGNISCPFSPWTVTVGGRQQTVWVHRNFLGVYIDIQVNVRDTVSRLLAQHGSAITEVYVTGHSLGGALAAICALDLQLYLPSTYTARPRLLTFGAPFTGNDDFAALLAQQVPTDQRFAAGSDWVPTVPTRGWTPAWMDWCAGGQHGPEPTPVFASYAQVGELQALTQPAWFPTSHALTSYYGAVMALAPSTVSSGFKPTDPVTSLVLRIKTADVLGAGTDVDISVATLGVDWGVLDKAWYDDFEQ